MATKKRDSRNIPKKIKINTSKGKNGFPETKEIRKAFQNSTDRDKYAARLLRRSVLGAFGQEKTPVYNTMVVGTREVKR